MTTIVYDRGRKVIASDSKNTDDAGHRWLCNKIESLSDGSYFLGSGHLHGIALCKMWAMQGWKEDKRPDFSYYLEDPEERAFQCMHVSNNGNTVMMIDAELMPIEVLDIYCGVGSGASYAIGALEAGASPRKALEIACKFDGKSCPPIVVYELKE